MTDGYIKGELNQSNRAMRFIKTYQTEIMIGAVVVLAVKNRGLRRDIKHLADASASLTKALEKTIEAAEISATVLDTHTDQLSRLRTDISEIDLDFEALYGRTNDLRTWYEGLTNDFVKLNNS